MITIIDYGMGNLGSVLNMFKHIGVESEISGNIGRIDKAKKILLPGVGAFDAAMQKIDELGLKQVLDKKALLDKIPVLGICLGMQLLTRSSEEGQLSGLGWIDAKTVKFRLNNPKLKIPHMGWNLVHPVKSHPIVDGLTEESRFYFVHSYYVKAENDKDVLANTHYGIDFSSMVQHDNIIGAQFHPEKSHKFGMRLLENFSKL
jgi:glutamine amidotransferase